jgi:hypothetical protein
MREAVSTIWAMRSRSNGGDQAGGSEQLRALPLLSATVRSPELRQACARVFRGRLDWAERERVLWRNQQRGKSHEFEGREGRMARRRPRADRRSSGEAFGHGEGA